MIRRAVRGTGKALISVGVLILLFVVYQLWGTGLKHDREQESLRSRFAAELASPTTALPASASPSPPENSDPPGQSVCDACAALISIPKIGLDEVVVEGVEVDDLKKGVGHYPYTKMPGEAGNAALAGHRTTYGAPFNGLDELTMGDAISVTTRAGTFRYNVMEKMIVTPETVEVLDNTADNRLTLTTCHPKLSAEKRLIIVAHLVGSPVDSPAIPADTVATTKPRYGDQLAAGLDRPGLSGGAAGNRPAIAWALIAASVWLGAWAFGRWSGRRWLAYIVGGPLFFVALFLFFENVARLLPANV